jgi:antitoxin VapB
MSPADGSTGEDRAAEVAGKLGQVRAFLEREQLAGLLLTRQGSVAWLTAGTTDPVVRGADPGTLWALVTRERAWVVTDNIDAARIEAEDPPEALGLELVALPWHAGSPERFVLREVPVGRLGNDGLGPGQDLSATLRPLRMKLSPPERARLRRLGRDARGALESAMRELRPGDTERALAAEVARRCELAAIFPQVLLVSGERRRRFRHPVPTELPIERDALGVLCGERGGLFVALSRSVSFGAPDPGLEEDHRIACEVDADLIAATRPGARRTYAEVLDRALIAYNRLGRPDEWQRHHQGGPLGYAVREQVVLPRVAHLGGPQLLIEVGNACAWNPSAGRSKSEDSFLVGEDGNELITTGGEWPQLELPTEAGAVGRPAILRLS